MDTRMDDRVEISNCLRCQEGLDESTLSAVPFAIMQKREGILPDHPVALQLSENI